MSMEIRLQRKPISRGKRRIVSERRNEKRGDREKARELDRPITLVEQPTGNRRVLLVADGAIEPGISCGRAEHETAIDIPAHRISCSSKEKVTNGGKAMFYVITRKTLGKGFLVMLLLALVLWLAWNTFGKDSALNNGGVQSLARLDLAKRQPHQEEQSDPSPLGVASEQVGPISGPDTYSVASEVDVVPTTISVGNLIDEYLPASPIYSEDLTFAIAAAGPLAVVEPLNRRDTFAEFRWERDRSRSRQLEVLQEIVTDGISSEQQGNRPRQVGSHHGRMWIEMELEGLLMAQGLPDAVVVLSETGATIMVDTFNRGRSGPHRRYCQRYDRDVLRENPHY